MPWSAEFFDLPAFGPDGPKPRSLLYLTEILVARTGTFSHPIDHIRPQLQSIICPAPARNFEGRWLARHQSGHEEICNRTEHSFQRLSSSMRIFSQAQSLTFGTTDDGQDFADVVRGRLRLSPTKESTRQEGLHISPAIGYDVDDHLFADHSINYAIGLEKCLAIFFDS